MEIKLFTPQSNVNVKLLAGTTDRLSIQLIRVNSTPKNRVELISPPVFKFDIFDNVIEKGMSAKGVPSSTFLI